MRKLFWLATLASAAAAAASLAMAVPARAASAGPHVVGTGTLGQFGDPTVRVNAIEAAGTARGSFAVTYPDGTAVAATDTCLFVSGTTAYVTGRIIVAHGPRAQSANMLPGNYVIVGVEDNGGAAPDLLNFSPGFSVNPGCGPNFAATPAFPIVKGHYRVDDN